MRLSRPVYETLPLVYVAIAGVAWLVAYLDPMGARSILAFVIGIVAAVAALTIFLHRHDCRAQSREYNGETIELPSSLRG
jgi:type IV secretory pathway VirB2 component (pilin)